MTVEDVVMQIGDEVVVTADNPVRGCKGRVVGFDGDHSQAWIEWKEGSQSLVPIYHLGISALASHNRGKTMNSVSLASEVRPSTLTESALDSLESAAHNLLEAVSSHENRIGICLRSNPPEAAGKGSATAVPDSTLLCRLESIYGLVLSARQRIDDISSRVTL